MADKTFQFQIADVNPVDGEVTRRPEIVTFEDAEKLADGPGWEQCPTAIPVVLLTVKGSDYSDTTGFLLELCQVPESREATVHNFEQIAELVKLQGRDLVESFFNLEDIREKAEERFCDDSGRLDANLISVVMDSCLVFDGSTEMRAAFVTAREHEKGGTPERFRQIPDLVEHLFNFYTCEMEDSAVRVQSPGNPDYIASIFWDIQKFYDCADWI